jgi:histidyl-tRNA synthetase
MPSRKSKHDQEEKFFTPHDRLPDREVAFMYLRAAAAELAEFYGFEKTATSLVDEAKPFAPLVKAKLFEERAPVIWKARNGEELILRASGALALLHSYVTLKMNDLSHPLKFSFEGESFFLQGDRSGSAARSASAKGGWRMTEQMESVEEQGLMMIGEETAIAEAEIIYTIWKTLEKTGLPHHALQLTVNATGCAQCRGHFRSSFLAYFRTRGQRLCRSCRRNLKRLPTRVLLCKEEKCRMIVHGAPQVLDFLCETCKKHLRGVLEFLDEASIPYFLDSRLFREGSWFYQFVFEIVFHPELMAQDEAKTHMPAASGIVSRTGGGEAGELIAPLEISKEKMLVAEGGRVSYVGELIVGRRIDAMSGVIMLEALERVCREHGMQLAFPARQKKVFLAQLGDLAKRKSLGLMETLRQGGIGVIESLGRDSMKSQLNVAQRADVEIALILGQKEALDDTVIVRDVSSGMQETVSQAKLVEFLKKRMPARQSFSAGGGSALGGSGEGKE